MSRNYDVITFFSKKNYVKKAWTSHFVDILKKPCLLKESLKTLENLYLYFLI